MLSIKLSAADHPPLLWLLVGLIPACALESNSKNRCQAQPDCLPGYLCAQQTCIESGELLRRLDANLVGYWKLDGDARDSSATGAHGTLIGGPQWTDGVIGPALEFDGADDRVEIPDLPALRLTGAMTLAAWVYVDSTSSNGRIVAKQGGGGSRGWSLTVENGVPGQGSFAAVQIALDASTEIPAQTPAGKLPLARWLHLAGVYAPSAALRIYLDGHLAGSFNALVPAAQYDNPNLPVAIGARPTSNSPFDGRLDEVRIYNTALRDEEVLALFSYRR